ncbi:glycosyl hydrolase [Candidatus Latescibacterota bacterium]
MNLKEFINPPKQNRPSPFWTWNGEMETPEIETQIRDMKKKGFGGFFMHAGSGLKTEYMSDDWMKAVRRAMEVANELKIEAWLHDEEKQPSGFSGSKTADQTEINLPVALTWIPDAGSLDNSIVVLAYSRKAEDGTTECITEKPEDMADTGAFYAHTVLDDESSDNVEQYTDLLDPESSKTFMDSIHEKYLKLFKYDFGEHLPGFFTEDPNVKRSGSDNTTVSFPWTAGFADYFEKLHGYSPLGHLHHLLGSSPDGFKFRHDFRLAVNERFIEAYTIPISTWCKEHEIKLTGNLPGEHDFSGMTAAGGAVMAHYEYMDIPGVNYRERGIRGLKSLKQAASVANQLDKTRIIGRVFGSTGFGITFEDMKSEADLNCALGVNFISPQHVLYSMIGETKTDNPPSFSYHSPSWEKCKVINDYIARCSWAVSQGFDSASVLVMSPMTSVYGAFDVQSENGGDTAQAIEQSFDNVIGELLAEHIAFDIGDERILSRHGSVSDKTLRIGRGKYKCVILPSSLTWKSSTIDLLEKFGGKIIIMGDIPGRIDGAESGKVAELLKNNNVTNIADKPSEAAEIITADTGRDVSVALEDNTEAREVYVNHRLDAGAHILFLSNTSRTAKTDVTVTVKALGGVVELDPATGRAYRYNSEIRDNNTFIQTALEPSGSRIFVLDQTQTSVHTEIKKHSEEVFSIEGPYSFKKLNDNSLTIDRCTLEMNGRTIMENEPVWKVKDAVWEKTGLAEYRGEQPWILSLNNVRSKTNKTVLTYTFTIQDVPETIALAMEDSDRYTVEINGAKIDFTPGRWFIDRRYRVLNIEDHVVAGVNTIKATTDYLWDTELENVHIFGDFAVGAEADGFPIIKEPETLMGSDWGTQGYPFYAGTMVYRLGVTIEKDESARYEIDLSGASGSVFSVVVNDEDVGVIPFPPYRGDITGALKNGDNVIEIEVAGSLRNVYGPLHYKKTGNIARTGPEQFRDEANWTDSYNFVPYGLIDPPKLIKII